MSDQTIQFNIFSEPITKIGLKNKNVLLLKSVLKILVSIISLHISIERLIFFLKGTNQFCNILSMKL